MKQKDHVGVIGAGSWGTAVANIFSDSGYPTTIWGRDPSVVEAINSRQENSKYLKGLPLSESLKATCDLEALIGASSILINGIPTQQIRSVFAPFKAVLKNKILVNTAKGIEQKTHLRVSEIFREIRPDLRYCVLSGPSFAQEVANT